MALRKEEFGKNDERARAMKDNQPVQRDQITLEVNRELYRRIKAAATRRHITIAEYVVQILDEMVPEINEIAKAGHSPTPQNIERLRKLREELFRENDYQFFEDSVEEIRKQREERLRELMGEE